MARAKHFPPVQYLNECFAYEPMTGLFRWRQRPVHHFDTEQRCAGWNGRWAGKPAFEQVMRNGYKIGRVSFDGQYFKMLAHRVAFALMTGQHPEDQIDHIDRNRANNSWVNLRAATQSENNWNAKPRLGRFPTGVQKNGKNGFEARIQHDGEVLYLGTYRTVAEAAAVRAQKVVELRSEFLEATS